MGPVPIFTAPPPSTSIQPRSSPQRCPWAAALTIAAGSPSVMTVWVEPSFNVTRMNESAMERAYFL